MTVRRILSIDGGGVRGIVAAVLLDELERARRLAGVHRPICDEFDLIAGASSGAQIAAALAAPNEAGDGPRRTAAELIELFRTRSIEVFPPRPFSRIPILGQIRQLFGPLYKPAPLRRMLSEEIGPATFGEARRNLLIPAYSIDPRDAVFFRGGPGYAHDPVAEAYAGIPIHEAAAASSAAPTFFPPLQVSDRKGGGWTLIDGGVYANDPAMAVLVEALRLFPGDELRVLSIGTGRVTTPFPFSEAKGWGFFEWISPAGRYRTPLLSVIADGQTRAVNMELTRLLDTRYRRFDYTMQRRHGSPHLDNASRGNLKRLEAGARQMAKIMHNEFRMAAEQFLG